MPQKLSLLWIIPPAGRDQKVPRVWPEEQTKCLGCLQHYMLLQVLVTDIYAHLFWWHTWTAGPIHNLSTYILASAAFSHESPNKIGSEPFAPFFGSLPILCLEFGICHPETGGQGPNHVVKRWAGSPRHSSTELSLCGSHLGEITTLTSLGPLLWIFKHMKPNLIKEKQVRSIRPIAGDIFSHGP